MPHEEKTYTVEYNSNNSGGSWWLKDYDWAKLELDGWKVRWGTPSYCHSKYNFGSAVAPDTCPKDECPGHTMAETYEEALAKADDIRWLGALAREATIEVKAYSRDLAEGIALEWWENTLGYDAREDGCECCGRPHSFYAGWQDPQ